MSCFTCHVSHVMCHLSPVTCHLTNTLCSFACFESPRRFGDVAGGGLINRIKHFKTFKSMKNILIKEKLSSGQSLLSSHFALKRRQYVNTDGGKSSV